LKIHFFFLFGDHGIRFGEFRQTLQGKMEERLPAMYIKLPDWFSLSYPKETANIKKNQNRLTTPFSIYGTLKHVIQLPEVPVLKPSQRSLFSEISPNRTCEEALIDDHWCSCKQKIPAQIDQIVIYGTSLLVREINSKIKTHGDGKCAEFELSRVLFAEAMSFKKEMLSFYKTIDKDGRKPEFGAHEEITEYQVQFEVKPGGGIFEGDFTVRESEIFIGTQFSRLNAYGHLRCDPKPLVREFCYCWEQTSEKEEEDFMENKIENVLQ